MKRLGILSLRWATAAFVGAALVLPQVLRAQGPAQGIKVHGHWVIEVRNADGSLGLRREFENALTVDGRLALAQVLSGATNVARWGVRTDAGCGSSNCLMREPSDPLPASTIVFKNLTKTVANSQLVLQGSFVASGSGGSDMAISAVSTEIFLLPGPASYFFTSANLAAPISVQATETVSVTVTFTFS